MWLQIQAIAWAQFRTTRNHLPRSSWGAILAWLVSLLWYGLFAAVGVAAAVMLPRSPFQEIRTWLPAGLLAVFLFWQFVPLFTLSSGWSLQLNKLQAYPVSKGALFAIEVVLRLTTAPEMIIVLIGAFAGLLRHPAIHSLAPLWLLLFIPLNLFLSLYIREIILHSFARNRFRDLFAIVMISIGVLPQLVLRTSAGRKLLPYFMHAADGAFTPWHETAVLSLGLFTGATALLLLGWVAASFVLARYQFEKSLSFENSFRGEVNRQGRKDSSGSSPAPERLLARLSAWPSRIFKDPFAAILQKEFQMLVRMPRFRVIFGMACVFGMIIFVPLALNTSGSGGGSFMRNNFISVVTLYGLLLLSDVLLFNIFGFDRGAAQIYFVAPVPFETVIKAKNMAAAFFIVIQAGIVLIIAALIRMPLTLLNGANAIAAALVVGLFFLSAGNLTSVSIPRPVDPTQTFRKQAGGKMQLWFLLCSTCMFLLVGFAFLARWALNSNWALLTILFIEFAIGLIVYRLSLQSAASRALAEREKIVSSLRKRDSPIGLGLS